MYVFERVNLDFEFGEATTTVTSTIRVRSANDVNGKLLFLNGDELVELVVIEVDGVKFMMYEWMGKGIMLRALSTEAFDLRVTTTIKS